MQALLMTDESNAVPSAQSKISETAGYLNSPLEIGIRGYTLHSGRGAVQKKGYVGCPRVFHFPFHKSAGLGCALPIYATEGLTRLMGADAAKLFRSGCGWSQTGKMGSEPPFWKKRARVKKSQAGIDGELQRRPAFPGASKKAQRVGDYCLHGGQAVNTAW